MSKAQALLHWIDERFPLSALWREHLSEYYAPKNFNLWYYFGSLALLVAAFEPQMAVALGRGVDEAFQ